MYLTLLDIVGKQRVSISFEGGGRRSRRVEDRMTTRLRSLAASAALVALTAPAHGSRPAEVAATYASSHGPEAPFQ